MKTQIKSWLEGNRDRVIKDNPYLSVEDQTRFINSINEMLESLNSDKEDLSQSVIEYGNLMLAEMNLLIDEARAKDLPTVEKFLEEVYKETLDHNFFCGTLNDMLTIKKFDLVIEYLEKIEVSKVQNQDIFPSIGIYSKCVSPLLRPIPKKEIAHPFIDKKKILFERWVTEMTKEDAIQGLLRSIEKYDKDVSDFDMLYAGGAPKDN